MTFRQLKLEEAVKFLDGVVEKWRLGDKNIPEPYAIGFSSKGELWIFEEVRGPWTKRLSLLLCAPNDSCFYMRGFTTVTREGEDRIIEGYDWHEDYGYKGVSEEAQDPWIEKLAEEWLKLGRLFDGIQYIDSWYTANPHSADGEGHNTPIGI